MNNNPENNSIRSGTVIWYRRPDFWFWAIAVAGLLFRFEYLREFAQFDHFDLAVGPDVRDYHNRALGILNGMIFPSIPDIHAPLYGFFLATVYKITGSSPGWARAIQLVLNWGAWLWLAWLIGRLNGSKKLILIFLSLTMFTPVLIFHQAELISESLLVIIFALCAWLLYRADKAESPSRWYFFAGWAAGLAVLTHGFMLAFAFAEVVYAALRRQWKRALLLACGVLAAVVPLLAMKSIHYGQWTTLQKNSAFNVWLGHNPNADGGCWLRPGKMWNDEHRNTRREADKRGISVERIYVQRIWDFYSDQPLALLTLTLKKVWKLILPVEFIAGADSPGMIYKTPLQYHLRFIAVFVGFFAICGVVLLRIKRQYFTQYLHFFLLTGSLALAQLLTVTSGRYRMGMMPGVLLLAALAIAELKRKRLIVALAGLALLAAIMPPAVRRDPESAALMGEVYFAKGKYAEAERELEFASSCIENPELFGNLRGIMAEKRGDFVSAENFYYQAFSDFDPEAYFNFGLMLSNHFPARRHEANEYLRCGLNINVERPDVWNQLGVNSVYLNDPATAEKAFSAAVQLLPEHPGYRRNLEFVRNRLRMK